MPLHINGSLYFKSTEVLDELDISRQTLWRWRQDPDFPQGAKLRGRLVFSQDELEAIKDYAFRLEPVEPEVDPSQLALFEGRRAHG
jgi:predicted DNA-binding transcriptional regulator AlpA